MGGVNDIGGLVITRVDVCATHPRVNVVEIGRASPVTGRGRAEGGGRGPIKERADETVPVDEGHRSSRDPLVIERPAPPPLSWIVDHDDRSRCSEVRSAAQPRPAVGDDVPLQGVADQLVDDDPGRARGEHRRRQPGSRSGHRGASVPGAPECPVEGLADRRRPPGRSEHQINGGMGGSVVPHLDANFEAASASNVVADLSSWRSHPNLLMECDQLGRPKRVAETGARAGARLDHDRFECSHPIGMKTFWGGRRVTGPIQLPVGTPPEAGFGQVLGLPAGDDPAAGSGLDDLSMSRRGEDRARVESVFEEHVSARIAGG